MNLDTESYDKFINGTLSKQNRNMFKIKQLPIKILNNSQFGALGSGPSFNWSDNISAERITCSGRLKLRHAIHWFNKFGLIPLYAVTDGVNFKIPDKTNIKITEKEILYNQDEGLIEDMWKFEDQFGLNAIIEKFNDLEMKKFMSVDNDGEFISCLNLARINYAVLEEKKDKETDKIKRKVKFTGNTIKSKVMPEYIEEFIDKGMMMILEGKGHEFFEYYKNYVDDIFYYKIPLKKIASKSKFKQSLKAYKLRGKDKNGREKGRQAHMELIINEREKIANELFEKYIDQLELKKDKEGKVAAICRQMRRG